MPKGAMCDDHPDRAAESRVQIEADSIGSEYADLCSECLELHRKGKEERVGRCEWCRAGDGDDKVRLHPVLDYEEGSHGPVYHVCTSCVDRRDARLQEEYECESRDGWRPLD